ncbi:MAG: bifunctional riboflavin kinase/FAD synthetase [Clostridiales bacterium]
MDGFININKPKDFTSHDVVSVLKRSFRGIKIGHGGTLDPDATGVLPICLGKGTKLQDYVMGQQKKYRAEIIFGYHSPTLDKDGDYFIYDENFTLDSDKLNEVLPDFIGEISQIPPMVSAIKKDGVALYKLAQRGIEIPRESRLITIYDIKVGEMKKAAPFPTVQLEITCSKGTYIRSLARDLGEALGTKAIIGELERVSTGAFNLENSYTMEEIAAMVKEGNYSFLLPLDSMLLDINAVTVKDMAEITGVLRGNYLSSVANLRVDETVKILDNAGCLLALAKVEDDLSIKPFKILYDKRKRKQQMQLWNDWSDINTEGKNTAVALGNFDGVHLGHKYLIEHMALMAEQKNLFSVVTAFAPHPRDFFNDTCHKYLQTKKDKIDHIANTGADALFLMPFNEDVAKLSPEEFIDDILVAQLHAKSVFVGYNFKFGNGAQGDIKLLQEYGAKKGIEISILDKITYNDNVVSSSEIKQHLAMGDVQMANKLLGYNFKVAGEVVHGQQLGRTIGFPTANIDFSQSILLPQTGIYTTWAKYKGKRHPSVTNIGVRPTVGENLNLTLEVHILDEDPEIYGENLEVTFLNHIRSEEKFPDLNTLKIKIAEDAAIAQEFFDKRGEKQQK